MVARKRVKSDVVTWEDPPLTARGGSANSNHGAIAKALKDNPGAWARIGTYASPGSCGSMVVYVKKGLAKAYEPAGTFEAVSRSMDGQYHLFARYVGGSDA